MLAIAALVQAVCDPVLLLVSNPPSMSQGLECMGLSRATRASGVYFGTAANVARENDQHFTPAILGPVSINDLGCVPVQFGGSFSAL